MTSSPEATRTATVADAIDPLPPALRSMWRLCKLGYRHEPRLMLVSFLLSQLAALPDALLALWLMLLGKDWQLNPSYSPHSRDSLTGMVQPSGIA